MRCSIAGAVLAVGLVCMQACGSQSTSVPGATPTGDGTSAAGTIAPDFTGRDVVGKTFRLSDHLGKDVVLLDFWSTFCEPCKAEFPHLRAMFDGQRAKGLLVVGVAMDGPETVADVPSFVRRFDLDFPVVTDEDSRIASLYNPKKSMPLSVLIDRAGRIVAVREGYTPGDEKLVEADVQKALDQPAPPQ
jgi:peroxiredoxin